MTHSLRALRHPTFRIYFSCHAFSLVGTWMHQVAQAWLMYRLTNSLAMLGIVAAMQQAPGFFVCPFAGAIADRMEKRRILVVTQSLAAALAAVLAGLTLIEQVRPWHVLVAAALHGLIHGLDIPARQSFFVEMVGKEDLPNAIAMNSIIVNGARLIGPAIAGAAIVAIGEGWCFAFNAVSYVPIVIGLFLIRPLHVPRFAAGPLSLLADIRSALVHVASDRTISALLGIQATCALAGMPYQSIMPAHADRALGGDASTFGLIMACAGAGALSGSAFVATRRGVLEIGRTLASGAALFGAGLIVFSRMSDVSSAGVVVFLAGAGGIVQAACTNTLVQTLAPDHLRGRLVSFYTAIYMGCYPVGSFVIGQLAEWIGSSNSMALGGGVVILGTAVLTPVILRGLKGASDVAPIIEATDSSEEEIE